MTKLRTSPADRIRAELAQIIDPLPIGAEIRSREIADTLQKKNRVWRMNPRRVGRLLTERDDLEALGSWTWRKVACEVEA